MIVKLLHSARHDIDHLYNITELQVIHKFKLSTRRGFAKQGSRGIEREVARIISIHMAEVEARYIKDEPRCHYQIIRVFRDQETS